jgi:hypothetical protein
MSILVIYKILDNDNANLSCEFKLMGVQYYYRIKVMRYSKYYKLFGKNIFICK